MLDTDALLDLVKLVTTEAAARLLDRMANFDKVYVYSPIYRREIKAVIDAVIDQQIVQALRGTGLAVLSEESGYVPARDLSNYWFIVDPLDGTFNFVKELGPCAISVALWENQRPVFGVIYSLMDRQLAWGGNGRGAYLDGRRICVSETATRTEASLCTGFPVRFDFDNRMAVQRFWRTVEPYAKVRMLGSAAVSLLRVACGSADAYAEDRIMLWDVAAGLAIVEGAGGGSVVTKLNNDWCYSVFAANPALLSCV